MKQKAKIHSNRKKINETNRSLLLKINKIDKPTKSSQGKKEKYANCQLQE